MIVLREEHQVVGAREDDFEACVRDEWLPALAHGDEARLMSYLHLAHGSGLAYRVITFTLLRDGGAWEKLARRIDDGDLAGLASKLDGLRHDVESKLLFTLPWSKQRDFEIESIPTAPQSHEQTMFIEDTVWPDEGKLDEYIAEAGRQLVSDYSESFPQDARFDAAADSGPVALVDFEVAYRPAYGSHRRREIILWQRILQPELFWAMIRSDTPEEYKKPGRWMFDALRLRDQWQSRLLRVARWSPLW